MGKPVLLKAGPLPIDLSGYVHTAVTALGMAIIGLDPATLTYKIFTSLDGVKWTAIPVPPNVANADQIRGLSGSLAAANSDRLVVLILPSGSTTPELWSRDVFGTWTLLPLPPLGGLPASAVMGKLYYYDGYGFYLYGQSGGQTYVWIGTSADNFNGPTPIAMPYALVDWLNSNEGPSTGVVAGHEAPHGVGAPRQVFFLRSTGELWYNPGGQTTHIKATNPSNLGASDVDYATPFWYAVRALSNPARFDIWRSGDAIPDNFTQLTQVPDTIVDWAAIVHHLASGKLLVAVVDASNLQTFIYSSPADDGVNWTKEITIDIGFASTRANFARSQGIIFLLHDSHFASIIDESQYDPTKFDGGSPPPAPSDVTNTPPTPEGDTTLEWTDNSTTEDRFFVERSKDGGPFQLAESVAGAPGSGLRISKTTRLPGPGTYVLRVRAVDYDTDSISAPSNEVTIQFGSAPTPDIYIQGTGGLTLSGSATFGFHIWVQGDGGLSIGGGAVFRFMIDPSGIYTLKPGKTHDTLYERMPNMTQQDVPIPDPFLRTGFIGE